MPMYEFECRSCGHSFSQVMKVAEMEAAKPRCPKCNHQDVIQVLEPVFVRTARKA